MKFLYSENDYLLYQLALCERLDFITPGQKSEITIGQSLVESKDKSETAGVEPTIEVDQFYYDTWKTFIYKIRQLRHITEHQFKLIAENGFLTSFRPLHDEDLSVRLYNLLKANNVRTLVFFAEKD